MKRIFLVMTVFLAAMIVFPTSAAAQYNIMSGYNTTNLAITAANANAKAAAMRKRNRSAAKKKAIRKKNIRRKSRRISAVENLTEPKLKFGYVLPKTIEIV